MDDFAHAADDAADNTSESFERMSSDELTDTPNHSADHAPDTPGYATDDITYRTKYTAH